MTSQFVVVLSPAKTLDLSPSRAKMSAPLHFSQEAAQIAAVLQKKTQAQLKSLMGVSDNIASTVHSYYQSWDDKSENRPAAFSFDGPAYKALAAHTLSKDDLLYCQEHLRILCGLYGTARPLDELHPYRLEMSTKLAVGGAKDLYEFWGDKIALSIAGDIKAMGGGEDKKKGGGLFVINCASAEYWKSVEKHLPKDVRVVTCKFPGPAVYAKAARGAMVRYICEGRPLSSGLDGLKGFTGLSGEWTFDGQASKGLEFVFVRGATGSSGPPKKKAKK